MSAGPWLHRLAVALAYVGGAVIAGVGLMSAASILGRATLGRPILGDFELVEIGTAVAGSLFLPYCQATGGHIIVGFFTLRAGERPGRGLGRRRAAGRVRGGGRGGARARAGGRGGRAGARAPGD